MFGSWDCSTIYIDFIGLESVVHLSTCSHNYAKSGWVKNITGKKIYEKNSSHVGDMYINI